MRGQSEPIPGRQCERSGFRRPQRGRRWNQTGMPSLQNPAGGRGGGGTEGLSAHAPSGGRGGKREHSGGFHGSGWQLVGHGEHLQLHFPTPRGLQRGDRRQMAVSERSPGDRNPAASGRGGKGAEPRGHQRPGPEAERGCHIQHRLRPGGECLRRHGEEDIRLKPAAPGTLHGGGREHDRRPDPSGGRHHGHGLLHLQ